MNNKITFFIPAYNCEGTIIESINSILESNFKCEDEIVIVDDCSTDNTFLILEEFKKNHFPALKIYQHKRNKGGAAARNTAIEQCSNELLFCLDADNILSPNSIEKLKNYLMEQNAGVASFQYQHFFLENKETPRYIWSIKEGVVSLESHLKGENVPGQHGNYLFTKSSWYLAGGYAEGSGALDTSTFGLKQAITGTKIVVLKDSFYYHRLDFENSYWMRDAEAKLWSVSIKASQSLFPVFHLIDEKYLDYILGSGRYSWYYRLKSKPIKLVNDKTKFYDQQHLKIKQMVYPRHTLFNRIFIKIKSLFK